MDSGRARNLCGQLLRFVAIALFTLLLPSGCSSSSSTEDHSGRERDVAAKKSKRAPIYNEFSDARADIQAAVRRAAESDKRVLVKFGGNWCHWCYKLHDMFHHDPVIAPIIRDEYELVLVDSNTNRDLMERLDPDYSDYGYPWLAVFDAKGALLATQETGVLETGDKHDVEKVKAFLLRWQADAGAKKTR
jgi:thiol-disulfide isomerase/thioredoxin